MKKVVAFLLMFAAVSILSVHWQQNQTAKIKHISNTGVVSIQSLETAKASSMTPAMPALSFGGEDAKACSCVSWSTPDYYCWVCKGCTGNGAVCNMF